MRHPRHPARRNRRPARGNPAYILRALPLLAGLATAPAARAQVLDLYFPPGLPGLDAARGVSVTSRLRPEYDPLGIRVGDLMIHPSLDESLGFDSNAEGTPRAQPSPVITTAPALAFGEDTSNLRAGGIFTLANTTYTATPAQDRTDWTASLGGGAPVGRDDATLVYSHDSLHQDRTQLGAVLSDAPIPYTYDDLRAAYLWRLGARVSLQPAIDFSHYRFGEASYLGVPFPQQFRDRDVGEGGFVARYEFGELRSAVLVARAVDTRYIDTPSGTPSQNSTGYEVLAGLDYDASGIWRARALLGYGQRDFASPAYKTHASPVAEFDVIWNPSGLTTVTATALRTIEDPTVEGTGGYIYSAAKLAVDHEYRRDVLLHAELGAQQLAYVQTAPTETLYGASAAATWLINRNLRLTGSYAFIDKQAGPAQSYVATTVLLRLHTAL